ncbi:hypothetical protein QUB67_30760 [Microcoleus sp. ARI1-A1]
MGRGFNRCVNFSSNRLNPLGISAIVLIQQPQSYFLNLFGGAIFSS